MTNNEIYVTPISKLSVIDVKWLSKKFNIGNREKFGVFRDVITDVIRKPLRSLIKKNKSKQSIYNALKDVNFSVKRGEVLGIIGKNGAGKSTLLKILSRIVEPTSGEVVLRGRVGSLIEVGTGFHLELTGRENIYLNGAILGMKKKEVDEKFEEIVQFAGVGNYLDIPVKRYSSGMYVRLAFAVAAHLDTDILLVDEVLSVGDAEFQQKSLGKVKDIAASGRTVVFVSHNMGVISQLCTRCIYLSKGRIIVDGPPQDAISNYLASEYEFFGSRFIKKKSGKTIQIRKVQIFNEGASPSGIIDLGKKTIIRVNYDVNRKVTQSHIFIEITSMEGTLVVKSTEKINGIKTKALGKYKTDIEIPPVLINTGRYFLTVGCQVPHKDKNETEIFDNIEAFQFECVDKSRITDAYGSGIIAPSFKWYTQKIK